MSCEEADIAFTGQEVDPELQEYWDNFQEIAALYGATDQLNKGYKIVWGKPTSLLLGSSNQSTYTIIIDSTMTNQRAIEYIFLHECGHYFYRMPHNSNLVMTDYFSYDLVNEYWDNKEKYLTEFFDTIE